MPPKSTLVTLYGTVNFDHDNYSVSLDPPPKSKSGGGTSLFKGFCPWGVPDELLYTAPLDPEVNYTMRLRNLVEGQFFDFQAAKFYTLNKSDSKGYSPSGGLSGGAIAGIVIGCVAGVIILGGLILFILWKRRKTQHTYKA